LIRTWAIESVAESAAAGVFFMAGVITTAITAAVGIGVLIKAGVGGVGTGLVKEVATPLVNEVAIPLVNDVVIPGLVGGATVASSTGLLSCISSFFAEKVSPAKGAPPAAPDLSDDEISAASPSPTASPPPADD
jgi:hypothetical protein